MFNIYNKYIYTLYLFTIIIIKEKEFMGSRNSERDKGVGGKKGRGKVI